MSVTEIQQKNVSKIFVPKKNNADFSSVFYDKTIFKKLSPQFSQFSQDKKKELNVLNPSFKHRASCDMMTIMPRRKIHPPCTICWVPYEYHIIIKENVILKAYLISVHDVEDVNLMKASIFPILMNYPLPSLYQVWEWGVQLHSLPR